MIRKTMWLVVMYVLHAGGCFDRLCKATAEPGTTTAIALSAREIQAIVPTPNGDVILVTGRSERTIWRWSERRGLEQLQSLHLNGVEHDHLTLLGDGRWWYSYIAVNSGERGIYSIVDGGAPGRIGPKLRKPDVWLPLAGPSPRGLYVHYATPERMEAIEVESGGAGRQWTFAAPPRYGTYPNGWSAAPLSDGTIVLLCPEPGATEESPWRLVLRILDREQRVQEIVLREETTQIEAALAIAEDRIAIVVAANELNAAVIQPGVRDGTGVVWAQVAGASAAAGFRRVVPATSGFVMSWIDRSANQVPRVFARELDRNGRPGLLPMQVSAPSSAIDPMGLSLFPGGDIFWSERDVMMRRLPQSISGQALITAIREALQ